MKPNCLLCLSSCIDLYYQQSSGINWLVYGREPNRALSLSFYRCQNCDLIFKDPDLFPTPDAERLHYQNHTNNSKDPRYREFLLQLLNPLRERLSLGANGLDFGCGPEPVMSHLCSELGYSCESYDPFFLKNESVFEMTFDFVLCSEVFEHLHAPGEVVPRLIQRLNPGGYLAVMTERPPEDFAHWYYHTDPTHVVFYSERCFQWMAHHFNLSMTRVGKRVVLLQKPTAEH